RVRRLERGARAAARAARERRQGVQHARRGNDARPRDRRRAGHGAGRRRRSRGERARRRARGRDRARRPRRRAAAPRAHSRGPALPALQRGRRTDQLPLAARPDRAMSVPHETARVPWTLAVRLLLRDWRSGEVLVLAAALTIAVAAISAVAFFTDRVRQAITQEAGEALAADLRLESTRPLPERYRELARDAGLEIADVVHFRSVVRAGATGSLADVRGVSAGYPLRGTVRIADVLGGAPYDAVGVPAEGEVWAEPALLARLGADVGDELEVGSLKLRVAKTLEFRPDE